MNSYHDLLFWSVKFIYYMKLCNIWNKILDEFIDWSFLQSFRFYVVTSLHSIKLFPLAQPQILKSGCDVPDTHYGWSDEQTMNGYHGQNWSFEPFCTWDGKVGGWQKDESALLFFTSLHCSYPHNFDVKK